VSDAPFPHVFGKEKDEIFWIFLLYLFTYYKSLTLFYFDRVDRPNTYLVNSMLTAFNRNGAPAKALELFNSHIDAGFEVCRNLHPTSSSS